jgi:hypothetical protein
MGCRDAARNLDWEKVMRLPEPAGLDEVGHPLSQARVACVGSIFAERA